MSVKNLTAEALSTVEEFKGQNIVVQGERNLFTDMEADFSEILFFVNGRMVNVHLQVSEISSPNIYCKSAVALNLEPARYQVKVSRILSVGGYESLVESTVCLPSAESGLVRSVVREMFSSLLGY